MRKMCVGLGAILMMGFGLAACESHAQMCKSRGGIVHSVRVENHLAHYCTIGGKVVDRW